MKLYWAIIFLLIITNVTAVDLGSFSITNPRINVTYSQPVKIDSAILRYEGQSPAEYILCINPAPTQFNLKYSLVPTLASSADCSGAVQPMAPGPYRLTISAYSTAGPSQPNPPDVRTFILAGMQITLVSPRFGIGTTSSSTVQLRTEENISGSMIARPAVCRWTSDPQTIDPAAFQQRFSSLTAATSSGNQHSLTFPGRGTLQILCREDSGRITYGKFAIDFDGTPPRITANAQPATVTDIAKKYSGISITTDDNATCTVQQVLPSLGTINKFPRDSSDGGPSIEDETVAASYGQMHETLIDYATITDTTERVFSYRVTCKNMAGLSSITDVGITVRFGNSIAILEPGSTSKTNTFAVIAKPSFEAIACELNGTIMTLQDQNYTAQKNALDGINDLNITCFNTLNQPTMITHRVTVDGTGPTAPTITASNAICDGRLTARFESTDSGGIQAYNYTISDGTWEFNGRSSGTASVIAPRLIGPSVTWTVFATDVAGNDGRSGSVTLTNVHVGDEEECGGQPFITLISPTPLGYAERTPYNIVIGTTRAATCKYHTDTKMPGILFTAASGGLVHSKQVQFDEARIMVNCTEPSKREHIKFFNVGSDTTAPVVSVAVDPSANIVDRASTLLTITATSDDKIYCTFDGTPFSSLPRTDAAAYTQENSMLLDLASEPQGVKTHTVFCSNLAQLNKTVAQNIVVDYAQALRIDIISPPAYVAVNPQLQVRPNKQSTCTYQYNTTSPVLALTESAGVHSANLGGLADGSHSIIVNCTSRAEGEKGVKIVDFTIDRIPPTIENINGPSAICINQTAASFSLSITSLDQDPGISFSIDGPTSATYTGRGKTISVNPTTLRVGVYTLSASARSAANVAGPSTSIQFEILAANTAACSRPGSCSNGIKDAGENGIDCGGVCTDVCLACAASTDCPEPKICTSGQCVLPAGACTNTEDCPQSYVCRNFICVNAPKCTVNGDCDTGEVCINDACVRDPLHCENGIQDSDEDGLDCGGECEDCLSCTDCPDGGCIELVCIAPVCVLDDDCDEEMVCEIGVCVPSAGHCTNNIKDNDETGVDCGGSCGACRQCNNDAQCAANQACTDGLCVPRIDYCDDGMKNNDETDVDCGGSCGACVSCSSNAQCVRPELCVAKVCQPPRPECEVSSDCPHGNVCQSGACVKVIECTSTADCSSDHVCTQGVCVRAPPTCTDGRKNGQEEHVDCGGPVCVTCLECEIDDDCPSGDVCDDNVCMPTYCSASRICPPNQDCVNLICVDIDSCDNDIADGDEEGIDCGGSCPTSCVTCLSDNECYPDICRGDVCVSIEECIVDGDCLGSEECIGGICINPISSCTNGILDSGEEDIDCGGNCDACVDCSYDDDCISGKICIEDVCITDTSCTSRADCQMGYICLDNACVLDERSTCSDNFDCDTPLLCAAGYCVEPTVETSCTHNNDCPPGDTCFAGVCISPPLPISICEDGVQDGDEEDLDCGGSCEACITCFDDSACGEDVCVEDVCVDTSTHATCQDDGECPGQTCTSGICTGGNADFCSDGVLNNDEENIDCGGGCNACVPCMDDVECPEGQICSDLFCTFPERASCSDGLHNGDEEDVDCGGRCTACMNKEFPDDINDPINNAPEEKSYLVSLLLIGIGIAIMGGSGYFLYQQNDEKQKASRRTPTFQQRAQPIAQMSPELQAKYKAEQDARTAALKAAYDKRMAEKSAERKATLDKFGDEQKSPETKPTEPIIEKRTVTKKPKDDPFDELDEISKDAEKKK